LTRADESLYTSTYAVTVCGTIGSEYIEVKRFREH
jgi:hypothetical protein